MKEIFFGSSKEDSEALDDKCEQDRIAKLLAVFAVGYGHQETTVNVAKKMRECGESFLKF